MLRHHARLPAGARSGLQLSSILGQGTFPLFVLHGLVRPDDIARDNTLLSSNIADARVEFFSEGSLTDAQKRGWFAKLYEMLRPL